ncbi:hypothetical protein K505DRAFT_342724 [Melanomma pulvis-pyrius CBS 109.77]|uniref:Uncharacterized protein n=1 Tax=Melanomma pulvis-pyrius CBS 109.77 TaxID=1314802 RepID=A0A6A6WUW5_9PLEO|nr:hypothetical protein K505DRAFT_342724 [Melanomma pulvis-pyrius CBS 109.77]
MVSPGNGWGNFAARIAHDDRAVIVTAKRDSERVGGVTFLPKMLETFTDKQGRVSETLHEEEQRDGDTCAGQQAKSKPQDNAQEIVSIKTSDNAMPTTQRPPTASSPLVDSLEPVIVNIAMLEGNDGGSKAVTTSPSSIPYTVPADPPSSKQVASAINANDTKGHVGIPSPAPNKDNPKHQRHGKEVMSTKEISDFIEKPSKSLSSAISAVSIPNLDEELSTDKSGVPPLSPKDPLLSNAIDDVIKEVPVSSPLVERKDSFPSLVGGLVYKSGGSSPRVLAAKSSSSTLNSTDEGGVSLLVDHWDSTDISITDRPFTSDTAATNPFSTTTNSVTTTFADLSPDQIFSPSKLSSEVLPSEVTNERASLSSKGRIDYSKLPRSEWFIWRRCCTCHTVYFVGGIYYDQCACGHKKCQHCYWETDFGYPPMW